MEISIRPGKYLITYDIDGIESKTNVQNLFLIGYRSRPTMIGGAQKVEGVLFTSHMV